MTLADLSRLMPPNMAEATRLTRAGQLAEAAALLQRGLSGGAAPAPATATATATATAMATATAPPPAARPSGARPRILDIDPETGAVLEPPAERPQPPAGAGLRGLLDRLAAGGLPQGLPAGLSGSRPTAAAAPLPAGARFLSLTHAGAAGRRDYRLYIPASLGTAPAPLLVMLHGCTQSPEDFAAGTRMNEMAERHGLLVAYPAQLPSANAQKCWNWFNAADQGRDRGEPALIAGLVRDVLSQHGGDPTRVFVAGLSAGGAAAAILGQAYPDLFAAIGVHSGLACGAARDMPGAFAAMRQGGAGTDGRPVPAIVFHADRDTTVHPRNADQVMAQASSPGLRSTTTRGQVPGGHAYTRTTQSDAAGRVVQEQWTVHGGGHAWAGGSAAGSYTDPRGPDASAEMVRFFLDLGK